MSYVYFYDLYLRKSNRLPYLKRRKTGKPVSKTLIESPVDLYQLVLQGLDIHRRAEEYAYMIALDGSNYVLGVFEISHGTAIMTLATPREIFIRALLIGAVSIILVHNHPSGNLTPSNTDKMLSSRMYEVGETIGIPLQDFMIVSTKGYLSFIEYALLKGADY